MIAGTGTFGRIILVKGKKDTIPSSAQKQGYDNYHFIKIIE